MKNLLYPARKPEPGGFFCPKNRKKP